MLSRAFQKSNDDKMTETVRNYYSFLNGKAILFMYVAIIKPIAGRGINYRAKTGVLRYNEICTFSKFDFAFWCCIFITMGDRMETYMTIGQLAEHLKLVENTIRRWVRNGEIPHHRINRVIRFKLSKVESWLDRNGAYITSSMNESK